MAKKMQALSPVKELELPRGSASKTSKNPKPAVKQGDFLAKEAAAIYGGSVPANSVGTYDPSGHLPFSTNSEVTILGGALSKPEGQMTALEKMDIVRTGVSKKELERLKEKTGLDYDTLARALSVTRATLINKKNAEKFNTPLSERIVGLADIYSYGYEVFEDRILFNKWMFRPNQALGGQAPYELVDNQFGREEVKTIIGRIEYGVYS